MKRLFAILALVCALPACSDAYKTNGPVDAPSAFIGSLIGRWTTGCVVSASDYMKQNLLITATGGLFAGGRYKDAECKVLITPNGPTPFTYTIEQKPELGEAIIISKENGRETSDRMKAILFDDSLSITVWNLNLQFKRVTGK